jgi:hypothetical protein
MAMTILYRFRVDDLTGWQEAIRISEHRPRSEIVEIKECGGGRVDRWILIIER